MQLIFGKYTAGDNIRDHLIYTINIRCHTLSLALCDRGQDKYIANDRVHTNYTEQRSSLSKGNL
jgi:hypothetical protein